MEKAIRSSLAFKQIDYDTGFKDSQRLEDICSSLKQTFAILQATLDIANSIQKRCEALRALGMCEPVGDEELLQSVAYDICRVEAFQRTATALSEQAEHASHLVRAARLDLRQGFKLMFCAVLSCSSFCISGRPTSRIHIPKP
jgi:hypothetical protein